jgi:hypothetical protein
MDLNRKAQTHLRSDTTSVNAMPSAMRGVTSEKLLMTQHDEPDERARAPH